MVNGLTGHHGVYALEAVVLESMYVLEVVVILLLLMVEFTVLDQLTKPDSAIHIHVQVSKIFSLRLLIF